MNTTVRCMTEQQRIDRPYQSLLEASPIPTWIIDPATGRFLVVNDAALRQYGYTRDEFLAMSTERIRLPAENGPLRQYVHAHPSGSFVVSGSWHHRRKNGSVLQVELSAQNITFAGRPALLTFVVDPKSGRAPGALEISERQLQEAQALAQVGSWEWNIAANRVSWSDEFYRICDAPRGSPCGYDELMKRVHPKDRERVGRTIDEALTQRLPYIIEYECRIVRPSGEIRHILNRNLVSVDANGQPERMVGVFLDITDRCAAEDALVDSERSHRELAENALDLVTIINTEGFVQYTSPSVQRLLGFSTSELLGRSVLELIHPDDAPAVLEAIRRDLAEPNTTNTVEFRFRHRDGTWRVLESIGQAHEGRSGARTIVVNSRDVTDRKAEDRRRESLTRELRAAQLSAERATRAKSEFLANMSHEIRTPMNAVLGLTELLLDTELTAEQRRHLEMVRNSGEVLLALLNDILDLSKIEAEHLSLEAIPFDLAGLVQTTASLFALAARDRDLELLVDVGSDVPRYVLGDPTRLHQILTNLLGNAVKFTFNGEIVVTATLVGIDDGRATMHFAVRDTGVGIPPEKIESIFGQFSQVDSSTTRQYGGTGLGLAIARRLARLMGGELTVASAVRRGSEFSFTLSLPVEAGPASQVIAAPVRLDHVRALVVDDNATSRRIIREVLAPIGAEVSEASSGADALAALHHAVAEGLPYVIVLLDSQMPDRNGWSLADEIRHQPELAQTHLLMLTSLDERGGAEKCRELRIEGSLTKPVSRSDLVATIGSVLGRGETTGAIVTRHALTATRARLHVLLADDNVVNQEVASAMLRNRGHDVISCVN